MFALKWEFFIEELVYSNGFFKKLQDCNKPLTELEIKDRFSKPAGKVLSENETARNREIIQDLYLELVKVLKQFISNQRIFLTDPFLKI